MREVHVFRNATWNSGAQPAVFGAQRRPVEPLLML